MRLDDGDMLLVGAMKFKALHTPGHTRDSLCLAAADRVFTGDTLLIGGTGRTDLPTGDAEALHDSLFNVVLKLDPATAVYPAHDYKGRSASTIGAEIKDNPRLQQRERAAFVEMMAKLDLSAPVHLTEALRTNMSGGKTVAQLLAEATASIPFIAMAEVAGRVSAGDLDIVPPSSHACAKRTPISPGIFRARGTSPAASWSSGSTRSCLIPPPASSPAASSARYRPWPRSPCGPSVSAGRRRWTAG